LLRLQASNATLKSPPYSINLQRIQWKEIFFLCVAFFEAYLFLIVKRKLQNPLNLSPTSQHNPPGVSNGKF
jgi:hypothetical protein